MKVKICGINTIEFARQADLAGCDYLGLLLGITHLAEDKISIEEAKEIIDKSGVDKTKFVMVTHLLDPIEIITIIKLLGINNLQLHDDITIENIKIIRKEFPNLFIMKAVHVMNSEAINKALEFENYVDAIILDSRTETRLGGTGNTHDWSISASICEKASKPVFLAGGLNPDNVKEAIKVVKPSAVDVNSGVEFPNGDKSIEKMIKFVEEAKR